MLISKDGVLDGNGDIKPLQQNVSFVNKDGKAVVTIKLDNEVTTDGKYTDANGIVHDYIVGLDPNVSEYHTLAVDDTTFKADAFGGNGIVVADKIAPKLASTDPIQTVDADGDGQIDHIRIEFTEPIDNNYLSATTFSVAGYTVKAAATDDDGVLDNPTATEKGNGVDSKYVFLTVEEKTTPDTDATPNVQRVGTVKDVSGNEFTGLTSATASVDKAAPVIVAAKITTAGTNVGWGNDVNDVLKLTFSENVVSQFTDIDTTKQGIQISEDELNELLGTSLAYDTTNGTVVTAAVSGNTVTLTVTGAPFASSGVVSAGDPIDPADGADVIKDTAGNVINDSATVDVVNN
uniref:Uncharacterized protein n=1 Tax=Geobacillus sp. (strain WCH70) TaxID=471223 RepID=C5D8B2_GEOSW